ncbi:MAG: TIGR03960 family B12-binding radical SAM protein [Bilophila sp.]
MKELLSLLPRPSHYIGTEEGSVHKDPASVRLHCALAFPDLYEVGMSYLGHKILYTILNRRDDIFAERVFAPCREAGELLRAHKTCLATLESDTPLTQTHMYAFAITHELCFTNVLYMLELAGIPLRSADRGDDLFRWPLIVSGGGCAITAEPLAPFMDLMLLGEGEELVPELCDLLMLARTEKWSRSRLLQAAVQIPGVYAPSLYTHDEQGVLTPTLPDLPVPGRRIMADFDAAAYPEQQVVPFGAVHNRLSLEIARGCTRGCRFCQAGILYRPARERTLPNLEKILDTCLDDTGFDDVSFLSLSTGDFSALKALFLGTTERCVAEQISVSLPSLRVGSIDDDIMRRMAGIRRTGATLAPEAGSQRLRDSINKGVTEEGLMLHVRKLFEHGWQQVKLYFMIGLPGETSEDLEAILDLCRKVRDAAGRGMPRLQVTAAISPFVPKSHTPFQWEPQITLEQMRDRVRDLRNAFRVEKNMKLRWHEPEMSHLEGILSRGDRRLADVVETAYRKGAIFTSWADSFTLEPWLEALAEHGLTADEYTGARALDAPLPWDHLNAGVSRAFLLHERERAFEGKITDDCRYAACRQCGACDTPAGASLLPRTPGLTLGTHHNVLNFAQRDQEEHTPNLDEEGRIVQPPRQVKPTSPPAIQASLAVKAVRFRLWHTKEAEAAYVSQLELQSLLERAMRRAGLPLAFSQGFHPLPLISFGRALPVGVESQAEWFSVVLREPMRPEEVMRRLTPRLIRGMRLDRLELIPINDRSVGSLQETFSLRFVNPGHDSSRPDPDRQLFMDAWNDFAAMDSLLFTRETKKGPRTADIRPLFQVIEWDEHGTLYLVTDWTDTYISPLTLARAITPWAAVHQLKIMKLSQVL